MAQAPPTLLSLPLDCVRAIVVMLPSPEDVNRVLRAYRVPGVIEALQARPCHAVSLTIAMPKHETSVVQWFLWCERLLRDDRSCPLACGEYHSAFIIGERLLTCGTERALDFPSEARPGLLGHDGIDVVPIPKLVPVTAQLQMRSVAASQHHTLALSCGGAAFSFGLGTHGQLGLGHTERALQPTRIELLPSAVAISAGQYHSAAITLSGNVYTWGEHTRGQLGHGEVQDSSLLEPRLVAGLQGRRVSIVTLGATFSYAVSEGTLYSWGEWDCIGCHNSRTRPTRAMASQQP